MKIIFDNEKQKSMLLRALGTRCNFCPSDFGLKDCDLVNRDCAMSCDKCFENCGLEMEVVGNEDHI